MIDVAKEVSVFKPIDLTHIPEKYRPATEQMRTAFILYNKALHEVQLGHEDIAKNYLRKAITIYPDFYDAVMVLGIIVFANGDRIGAVRIFNSVRDVQQRTVSIGILDHLVEEAERPMSVRNSVKTRNNSSHENRKLANVMSNESNTYENASNREAKYSKGQVFERSSGYYEPQPLRNSSNVARKSYGNFNRKVLDNDNKKVDEQPQKQQTIQSRQPEEAIAFKKSAKDVHDVKLLNKYLLIMIGIFIAFVIFLSTLLINKTAEVRKLEDNIKKENLTSFIDSFSILREEKNENTTQI